jgi:hypothetical protein
MTVIVHTLPAGHFPCTQAFGLPLNFSLRCPLPSLGSNCEHWRAPSIAISRARISSDVVPASTVNLIADSFRHGSLPALQSGMYAYSKRNTRSWNPQPLSRNFVSARSVSQIPQHMAMNTTTCANVRLTHTLVPMCMQTYL